MNLPTFIIAGAPRAGTTYLYELCDSHPSIYMAKPFRPEPKFFLIDEEYQKGLDYYSNQYFAQANNAKVIGEKSTNYLENPLVSRRIDENLPNVKLVFALRNPITRAFSNYLWSRKNGLETLSFSEAVRMETQREELYSPVHRFSRPYSYISRGMYANLIKPYLERFGSSRIQIILLEDIIKSPYSVAESLFGYLGVPPLKNSEFDFDKAVNSAREGGETMTLEDWEYLRGIYQYPNHELSELLGRDLGEWATFPDAP